MATTNIKMITIVIATISMMTLVISISDPRYPRTIVVGGDKGWTYGVDHQAFMNNIEMFVGDKLLFQYPIGQHDVVEVDAENFEKCTVPPGAKRHTSGKDLINIDKEKRRFFICSVKGGHHCRDGKMKFGYYFADNRPAFESSHDSAGSTGIQGGRKLGEEKL
ncbi:Cupredoxin [Artemisia annua]|uniref:Cupredoxin n=1 Tax=Artemisia annua TaxID=35608 RepID=A0A2U1M658_ARTAN|nr:Cupredoxin [Artemisia annua]